MSDERDVIASKPISATDALNTKFGGLSKDDIKARNVRIVGRSRVSTKLDVPNIPAEYHGEWVHLNDIREMEAKGFVVDDQFAVGIHNDGTGKPIVGDVIFMITTKENKEALDEILSEEVRRRQDPHKDVDEVGDLQVALGRENVNSNKSRRNVDLKGINAVISSVVQEQIERDLQNDKTEE